MLGAGYRIEEVRALLQQNRLHHVRDALDDVLANGKRRGVSERLAARLRGMVLGSGMGSSLGKIDARTGGWVPDVILKLVPTIGAIVVLNRMIDETARLDPSSKDITDHEFYRIVAIKHSNTNKHNMGILDDMYKMQDTWYQAWLDDYTQSVLQNIFTGWKPDNWIEKFHAMSRQQLDTYLDELVEIKQISPINAKQADYDNVTGALETPLNPLVKQFLDTWIDVYRTTHPSANDESDGNDSDSGNEYYSDAEGIDNQPSHETPREPRGPHPAITPGTLVVNSRFSGRSTRLLASRRRRI